jgi:hypothetical protein
MPTKKTFKVQPSVGKIMCFIFWDKRGVNLVNFLECGHMINSVCYVEALKKLKTQRARVRPEKKGKILFQYDNARPHISILTRETTAEFMWTVLPHPPYNPDLLPSDFHLFVPMNDGLHGRHFAEADVIVAIKKWFLRADRNSYDSMMQGLVQWWRKCVQCGGEYVEK